MVRRYISLFIAIVLLIVSIPTYALEQADGLDYALFAREELFDSYSVLYDTFNAVLYLEDGSEIMGFAFTDYAEYYERDDGKGGYFPAGFIADHEYRDVEYSSEDGLVIENLDFSDEQTSFLFAYEVSPYRFHCVVDQQYLVYGVGESGSVEYTIEPYAKENVDTSLGPLYSYDDNRYLYDPGIGDFVRITGESLYSLIDFAQVQKEVDRVIEEQNQYLTAVDVYTQFTIAREAVVNYFLSLQEETFLGFSVDELVEYASTLEADELVRLTPEGYTIISIEKKIPGKADRFTKWAVGIACGIVVAGSTALDLFVPWARPFSGAVTGAAVDVFMQVVVENKDLSNVQWSKVAVAAASGALMAWACPLAASGVTKAATTALKSEALGKLCGYGVLTISNSVVSGMTGFVNAKIDGTGDEWNALLSGIEIGAFATVGASLLSEALSAAGPKITNVLQSTKPGKFINKAMGKTDLFIRNHQVHLKNSTLEEILSPKSVHSAAEAALREINGQTGIGGGSFNKLVSRGDTQRHEMPPFESYVSAGNDAKYRYETDLPAIRMEVSDHQQTASCGASQAARDYRLQQTLLIRDGNIQAAIQRDIDDITSKFGTKYDDEILEMLDFAREKGFWK